MDLQSIVSPIVAAVVPLERVTIVPSIGYTTGADGSRTPIYGPPMRLDVQVQALQYTDLTLLEGLNIQGERAACYIHGPQWKGISRADQRGGDIISRSDGSKWLIALVIEDWGVGEQAWVKVAITRQINAT